MENVRPRVIRRVGRKPKPLLPIQAPRGMAVYEDRKIDLGPEPLEAREKEYRLRLQSGELWRIARVLQDSLAEDEHWNSDLEGAAEVYQLVKHFKRLLERGD